MPTLNVFLEPDKVHCTWTRRSIGCANDFMRGSHCLCAGQLRSHSRMSMGWGIANDLPHSLSRLSVPWLPLINSVSWECGVLVKIHLHQEGPESTAKSLSHKSYKHNHCAAHRKHTHTHTWTHHRESDGMMHLRWSDTTGME